MSKNLLIVESPAKKKTIQSFLGDNFIVESSVGHIRDLPTKGDNAIDIKNDFKPTYVITEDKKKVVKDLQKHVLDAETIWLATDEDREGEAIAWHLTKALNLKDKKINRIVFNEITKEAITKAINNPKKINENLVNAQQARRVLDRLVGFELSPLLWKKIKRGLSAGRVQSVAVRLIVEKENEISSFVPQSTFKIFSKFQTPKGDFLMSELNQRFEDIDSTKDFLNKIKDYNFKLSSIQKKPSKRSPQSPFTTSTLQQEASRKLGFSVNRTMSAAQKLYEQGKITYMRTDSTSLSKNAIKQIEDLVNDRFGSKFFQKRTFKNKVKGAQEAHEAIRPTNFSFDNSEITDDLKKLYDLIWIRSVSSQMSDAKLEKTTFNVKTPYSEYSFVSRGEVIIFPGFLSIKNSESIVEGILPDISENERLNLCQLESDQVFSKPPARYTEASLVKKLEELGIGRPSTYASTITTVQKRNYISKQTNEGKKIIVKKLQLLENNITISDIEKNIGIEKNKLYPTDIGKIVTEFLVKHFTKVLDYGFTASVENEFDLIAEGKKIWNDMIKNFYSEFNKKVIDVTTNSKRESGERVLGNDPATGELVTARLGPFGPMVQIGKKDESDSNKKPRYASLLNGQTIQSIDLETALDLFKLPRKIGVYSNSEIISSVGRFGPYLKHNQKFYSLKGTEFDPLSITEDEAINHIQNKIRIDKERIISDFLGDPRIQVLNGRYGPFVQITHVNGKKINLKIPKETEPKSLSREDCLEMLRKKTKS